MRWRLSHHADPAACRLADRHYSRKKVGSKQMMPPGRKVVLISLDGTAVWGVNWPYAELVMHPWPGAMVNTIFRNEGPDLSSDLIREAVAATVHHLGPIPDEGLITMIDTRKVRSRNPGYCFLMAGWERWGHTKGGHVVLGIRTAEPEAPVNLQGKLL